MVEIHVERTIAAPQDRVFGWLADAANLTTAPLIIRAAWATGTHGPRSGAVRNVLAAGMWLREEYTAYDAPGSYSYRIIRAVPAIDHKGGTLALSSTGNGTHVDWDTAYTHPAWVGGRALEAVTGPLIRSGFVAILDACATALEKP